MLDTNIVIYTMKNKPPAARDAFSQNDGRMCMSSVTLMELVYGAERSSNPDHNLRAVESFAARLEVLSLDAAAAHHAGQIRAQLASRGQPIGPYDQLIAGHARSLGLVLVTNNISEFSRVEGLRLENWTIQHHP
jgi:tRNA(fMet)-specific endonuclease VapC